MEGSEGDHRCAALRLMLSDWWTNPKREDCRTLLTLLSAFCHLITPILQQILWCLYIITADWKSKGQEASYRIHTHTHTHTQTAERSTYQVASVLYLYWSQHTRTCHAHTSTPCVFVWPIEQKSPAYFQKHVCVNLKCWHRTPTYHFHIQVEVLLK